MQTHEQAAPHAISKLAAAVPDSIVLVTYAEQTHGIVRDKLRTYNDALTAVRERIRELSNVPSAAILLLVRIEGDGEDEYCCFTGDAWTAMAQVAKYIRVTVEMPRVKQERTQQKQALFQPVTFPVKVEDDAAPPPREVVVVDSDDEELEESDEGDLVGQPPLANTSTDTVPAVEDTDVTKRISRHAPARKASSKGTSRRLTLAEHRQIEEHWLKARTGTPWIVPPVHLQPSLLERLGCTQDERQRLHTLPDDVEIEIGGNSEKRAWITRRLNRVGSVGKRKIITGSDELYEILVKTHVENAATRHASAECVRRKLHKKYIVIPERAFLERWIEKCPGCNLS